MSDCKTAYYNVFLLEPHELKKLSERPFNRFGCNHWKSYISIEIGSQLLSGVAPEEPEAPYKSPPASNVLQFSSL